MNARKTVLVIAADGTEDIELVATIDILRRSKLDVILANVLDSQTIKCSNNVTVMADAYLADVHANMYDEIVLPGGEKGTDTMIADERVGEILKRHEKASKVIAAICAAPLILAHNGIALGCKITSFPSVKNRLAASGYECTDEDVCVSSNVVTSRGPGTVFLFALKVVELLVGAERATSLGRGMLILSS